MNGKGGTMEEINEKREEFRKKLVNIFKPINKQMEIMEDKKKTYELVCKLTRIRQVEPEQLREPHNL